MPERTGRTGKVESNSLVSGLAKKLTELDSMVTRQADRLAGLLEIGTLISSAQNVDDLLGAVMDRLTSLLGAQAGSLFVLDERTGELWSRVLRGATIKEIRIDAKAGIAGWVFTHGKTLHLGDAYSDQRFNPEIDKKSGFRTRSLVATPLRHVSGRILGVLEVLDRRESLFSADDRVLVEGVAQQIAAVLDNVLLVEELTRRNETLKNLSEQLAQRAHDLDVLYGVEKAISSSEAQADLLDRILSKAIEVVGAEAGSVLLSAEDRGHLFFRTARGELTSLSLSVGRGITGQVAVTGEVVRLERAEESPWHDRATARQLRRPEGAVLCVPIPGEGRTLGALELLGKKGGFSDGDERLAVLLAGQVGRALVLRQSREEVERKARLATVGQMIASVLHDLRTPMTVMAGFAELMVDEPTAEGRREMSQSILSQLDHVAAMQRETLAFVRGEKSLLVRKVYLHRFVGDLEEQLAKEFAASKIELRVAANYTGAARFDETKVKRAVLNLARNALDAMPDGGHFTLSVDRDGDELVFRAADDGPGIPAEISDRLFDSFVTSGKPHGTGLGLAIVRRIAEEHGGAVSFSSKVGVGTTFELRLPAGVKDD